MTRCDPNYGHKDTVPVGSVGPLSFDAGRRKLCWGTSRARKLHASAGKLCLGARAGQGLCVYRSGGPHVDGNRLALAGSVAYSDVVSGGSTVLVTKK